MRGWYDQSAPSATGELRPVRNNTSGVVEQLGSGHQWLLHSRGFGKAHNKVNEFWAAATAGAAASLIIWAMVPLMKQYAVDIPNSRSSHLVPTPRGGGLGILAGAAVYLSLRGAWSNEVAAVCIGITIVAVLGLFDDVRGLSRRLRLSVQIVIALAMISLVTTAYSRSADPKLLVIIVGTIWLSGYTNAFNFMDGINGISAMSTILAAGWYAWLCSSLGFTGGFELSVAILVGALAFLPWNYPRATIFMGDVGSYGIGFGIACLAVLAWVNGASPLQSLAPLLLYCSDTAWTLSRRIVRREAWWEAHRDHIYQRLSRGRLGSTRVPLLVSAVSAGICLLSAANVTQATAWTLIVLGLASYLASPQVIGGSAQ